MVRSGWANILVRTAGYAALAATVASAQTRLTQPGPGPNGTMQTSFLAHHLATDHAEGVTSIDVNGDGLPDLLSGAYWYENPGPNGGEWVRHQYRTVGLHNEFISDSGEWAVDVNHDGRMDVVTAGWISNGVWWYENPGKAGGMWKAHKIADSFDTEGGAEGDINGDGKPDLIFAHYNHSGLLWIDFAGPEPKVHHVMGKEQDGHGVGVADINGDGKPDILTPTGWLQQINADADQWTWHQDWNLEDAGFPILAYDVNADGKMDVIYGQGHSYGLYWLEQGGSSGTPTWTRHIIDESYSQIHALRLVDLDGDGVPELVTGKRYRGHSGHDPGSFDPLVVYYYAMDSKQAKFTRYAISVNGLAGAGTQFVAQDLDGDGDIDLATAGKSGLTFFENLRINKVPPAVREKYLLLDKTLTPQQWPIPGEGHEVPQEDGPAVQK